MELRLVDIQSDASYRIPYLITNNGIFYQYTCQFLIPVINVIGPFDRKVFTYYPKYCYTTRYIEELEVLVRWQ